MGTEKLTSNSSDSEILASKWDSLSDAELKWNNLSESTKEQYKEKFMHPNSDKNYTKEEMEEAEEIFSRRVSPNGESMPPLKKEGVTHFEGSPLEIVEASPSNMITGYETPGYETPTPQLTPTPTKSMKLKDPLALPWKETKRSTPTPQPTPTPTIPHAPQPTHTKVEW